MRRRHWIGLLVAVVAFIGGAIANQLIGGLGSELILALWNNVIASIKISMWPWIFTLIFFIATLVLLIIIFILNRARSTANNLLEMDDSMTRLLASWIPGTDHTEQVKGILQELLRDACRELGHYVQRAAILLPETPQNEFLTIWVSHGMPKETIERVKFYVGRDAGKESSQGVAGKVYLEKEHRVAHITKVKGVWHCDCSGFIRFSNSEHMPAYHSFVCMPIFGPSSDPKGRSGITCLGVLCFDSLHDRIFDNSHARYVLRVFARRIAFALSMSDLLP